MTDYVGLACQYGGFTNLDRAYLTQVLAGLSDRDKLIFITPPPSVINAYFAEIYDKQGPLAATTYFFELSQALSLFQTQPSFKEEKPFIRLSLSEKSYGFAYLNSEEEALIFAEVPEVITGLLLLDIAKLFPHYKVYQDGQMIKMKRLDFDETVEKGIPLEGPLGLLTHVSQLRDGFIKIVGYNKDDILTVAAHLSYQMATPLYSAYIDRQFIIYGRKV